MKQLIFESGNDWPGLILRLTLGLVMFPHGAQKALGTFGGQGFTSAMHYFTDSMKLPWLIAFMVIVIEFVGSFALLIGFASRVWATGLMAIMIGAIVTTHGQSGFFMNWFGNQSGEGYEYHLLVIGLCLAVLLTGSGRYAVDQLF